MCCEAFSSFLYFSKSFFTEIYFWFYNLQVCTHTAWQEGGRGLYAIKISVLSHEGPYRPAGGRQAPPQYKSRGPLTHMHLQQTTSIEGKRRDVGVREGVATAKPCRIPHL